MKFFFSKININTKNNIFLYFTLLILILSLFKPYNFSESKSSEEPLLVDHEDYNNLFENNYDRIQNFIENFNYTEYEENCLEAKYEKCYEISSYYVKNLKFTNFTQVTSLQNLKSPEKANETGQSQAENSDQEKKDSLVFYNNILSNFYYYAATTEYYGIVKKKPDLANGLSKLIISAYYGNPKSLYELYIILESEIYKILFDLKQYKTSLEQNKLLKYISKTEFYKNFLFESDYERNSISLVFLYTSAILKHPPALNTLAYKYYRGEGVPKNCETSLKYYKEISMLNVEKITNRKKPNHYEKVNIVAYEYPGFLQNKDSMNINAIIDYLKVEASNGHANVMQQLGQKFLFGQGIDQNFKESFHYFKLGYSQNDTLSTYYLGEHYLNGWGVELNYEEALRLFNKAVQMQYDPSAFKDKNNKQSVAKALNSLGYMYYNGYGVDKNVKRAYDYFKSKFLFANELI